MSLSLVSSYGMSIPSDMVGSAIVRTATPNDLQRLRAVLTEWHERSGLPGKLSQKKLVAGLRAILNPDNGIMVAYIDAPDGSIAASLAIGPYDNWYSEDFALNERWFFVREPYRRQGYDRILMEYARVYRDNIRLRMGKKVPLYFGVMDSVRLETKIRLFRRYGRMIAAIFVMRG